MNDDDICLNLDAPSSHQSNNKRQKLSKPERLKQKKQQRKANSLNEKLATCSPAEVEPVPVKDVKQSASGTKSDRRKRLLNADKKTDDHDNPAKRFKFSSLFTSNPEIPKVESVVVQPVKEAVFADDNFASLPLHPYMISNLEKIGMTKMTSVQQQSIPLILEGQDVLIRSQTGSGKTLSYAVPIVENLQSITPKVNRSDGPYCIVIVPTRELALQSFETFQKLVRPFMYIVPGCIMGGERKKSEKARLRRGINILIATPGRLVDHITNTKSLLLNCVRFLVIDEADRLLDLGFERDVSTVVDTLGKLSQRPKTIMLSATLSAGVERLAGITMQNPVQVDISHMVRTKISRGGKEYSNHLKEFTEFEAGQDAAAADRKKRAAAESLFDEKTKQPRIRDILRASQKFKSSRPVAKEITRLIGMMIALDNQPFTVVKDAGFHQLLHFLEPRYEIPSGTYFSQTFIPELYHNEKEKLQERVDKAEYVSFTCDRWTSDNNLDGFMTLTGHWIDDDWTRQHVVFGMKPVAGSHTGELIAETLTAEIAQWKISDDRRVIMLRDNTSAMSKATDLMAIESEPCVIDTLQLVVGEGLKEQMAVIDTLAVGRAIVGHFRHYSLASSRLEAIQRQELGVTPGSELRVNQEQDVSTRWNSSFYMLERLLLLKKALVLYASETDAIKMFTSNQWDLASKIVRTLQPFEEKMRLASMNTSSIALIIPTVRALMMMLEKTAESGLGSMHTAMFHTLQRRFDSALTKKALLIATTLSPSYKLCWFQSQETKDLAAEFVVQEAVKMYEAHLAQSYAVPGWPGIAPELAPAATVSATSLDHPSFASGLGAAAEITSPATTATNLATSSHGAAQPQGQGVGVQNAAAVTAETDWEDSIWQEVCGNTPTARPEEHVDVSMMAAIELRTYLEQPLQPLVANPAAELDGSAAKCNKWHPDPVIWWRQNSAAFPLLARVAKKYLSAPASSVSSERLFSTAGNTISDVCSRLDPDHAEMLVFLNKNLPRPD